MGIAPVDLTSLGAIGIMAVCILLVFTGLRQIIAAWTKSVTASNEQLVKAMGQMADAQLKVAESQNSTAEQMKLLSSAISSVEAVVETVQISNVRLADATEKQHELLKATSEGIATQNTLLEKRNAEAATQVDAFAQITTRALSPVFEEVRGLASTLSAMQTAMIETTEERIRMAADTVVKAMRHEIEHSLGGFKAEITSIIRGSDGEVAEVTAVIREDDSETPPSDQVPEEDNPHEGS